MNHFANDDLIEFLFLSLEPLSSESQSSRLKKRGFLYACDTAVKMDWGNFLCFVAIVTINHVQRVSVGFYTCEIGNFFTWKNYSVAMG